MCPCFGSSGCFLLGRLLCLLNGLNTTTHSSAISCLLLRCHMIMPASVSFPFGTQVCAVVVGSILSGCSTGLGGRSWRSPKRSSLNNLLLCTLCNRSPLAAVDLAPFACWSRICAHTSCRRTVRSSNATSVSCWHMLQLFQCFSSLYIL